MWSPTVRTCKLTMMMSTLIWLQIFVCLLLFISTHTKKITELVIGHTEILLHKICKMFGKKYLLSLCSPSLCTTWSKKWLIWQYKSNSRLALSGLCYYFVLRRKKLKDSTFFALFGNILLQCVCELCTLSWLLKLMSGEHATFSSPAALILLLGSIFTRLTTRQVLYIQLVMFVIQKRTTVI